MEPTKFHGSEQPAFKPVGNRIEFNVDKQTKLILDRGIEVLWEKSFLCTCRNPMTHAPNPSCHICHGRGIAYLPAKKVTIGIQSQEKSLNNVDLGLYDSGTAIGTTLPHSGITFRDRITLPDVTVDHSTLFDVTPKRVKDGMWLAYDVKKITYAVADDGNLIYPEEDYTLDVDKNLFKPRAHLQNQNVSLNITSTLRYIVIDLLKESRLQYTNKGTTLEHVDHLPKKLLLKREDAWINPTPFSMEQDGTPPVETEDPKRSMNTGGFFGGGLSG